jgi:hypothetical protein
MPGDRLSTMRPILFIATAAAACVVLAYGLFREEIGEVMFNAAML